MGKYFTEADLEKMDEYRRQIYAIREQMYREFGVDALDTDTLSSIATYQIVKQYDPDYNVNFARNGEDAKSGEVLIEQKACRVDPNPLTPTGRPRKGYNQDADFQFHAMGDLAHQRYILVARSQTDLGLLRIYDFQSEANCQAAIKELTEKKDKWYAKATKKQKDAKRDVITVDEKFVLANLKFSSTTVIDNCTVHRDW